MTDQGDQGRPVSNQGVRDESLSDQELVEELRTCFLFDALTPEQLAWLAGHGAVWSYPAGADVYREGEPATCFFVMFGGEIQLLKRAGTDDVVLVTSSQRGAYAGATRAFVPTTHDPSYANTMRTVAATRLFELAADDFAAALREWFPMAVHLLDGLFLGLTSTEALLGQREKLAALGALSAGLAHEINNPAAAAVRGAQALRRRIADAAGAMAALLPGLPAGAMPGVVEVQAEAIRRAREAPAMSALEAGDREDDIGAWLDDHGVEGGWDVAPALAAAGLDADWLATLEEAAGARLAPALRWVSARLEINALVDELEDAATRVSTLVGAVKEYTHMDRAAYAATDVHAGLESTLVMLGHKLKSGVEVVRDYDRSLPPIPAYGSELNQVWTNLIDNAIEAMGSRGRLLIRTAADGDRLLVEIADTGPGIPPELQRRVFEPFFTTKDVGTGTGLGLDISYRVIVQRHHGDLRLTSVPGDTRFQARLPFESRLEPGAFESRLEPGAFESRLEPGAPAAPASSQPADGAPDRDEA